MTPHSGNGAIHFLLPGNSQGSPIILPTFLASSQDEMPEIPLGDSLGGKEMAQQVKVLAEEASGPDFRSLYLSKMLGTVVSTRSLRAGKVERGGSLESTGYSVSSMFDERPCLK